MPKNDFCQEDWKTCLNSLRFCSAEDLSRATYCVTLVGLDCEDTESSLLDRALAVPTSESCPIEKPISVPSPQMSTLESDSSSATHLVVPTFESRSSMEKPVSVPSPLPTVETDSSCATHLSVPASGSWPSEKKPKPPPCQLSTVETLSSCATACNSSPASPGFATPTESQSSVEKWISLPSQLPTTETDSSCDIHCSVPTSESWPSVEKLISFPSQLPTIETESSCPTYFAVSSSESWSPMEEMPFSYPIPTTEINNSSFASPGLHVWPSSMSQIPTENSMLLPSPWLPTMESYYSFATRNISPASPCPAVLTSEPRSSLENLIPPLSQLPTIKKSSCHTIWNSSPPSPGLAMSTSEPQPSSQLSTIKKSSRHTICNISTPFPGLALSTSEPQPYLENLISPPSPLSTIRKPSIRNISPSSFDLAIPTSELQTSPENLIPFLSPLSTIRKPSSRTIHNISPASESQLSWKNLISPLSPQSTTETSSSYSTRNISPSPPGPTHNIGIKGQGRGDLRGLSGPLAAQESQAQGSWDKEPALRFVIKTTATGATISQRGHKIESQESVGSKMQVSIGEPMAEVKIHGNKENQKLAKLVIEEVVTKAEKYSKDGAKGNSTLKTSYTEKGTERRYL
uniref:Flocculation protein FLO11-like n=1 Tax=Phascolarctos cinereus TaxID=38626 RepID=A0A6P5IMR9_PHACI|nr:flocculation protein FLO11-like [Phascolarctos cinereus]